MRRRRFFNNFRRAFTLIELLIVVAIIAILAAVALPNLLAAQTRSKVSREMSDLRTIGMALEAYAVDSGRYPPHGEITLDGTVNVPGSRAGLGTIEFLPGALLTTPIAYLGSALEDPYLIEEQSHERRAYGYVRSEQMASILIGKGIHAKDEFTPAYGAWRLFAAGPDRDKGIDAKLAIYYDPTNGAVSDGDITRSQKSLFANAPADEGR
jgi:prepilin-type N-terminal cleavage/methylation domain-containing protein